MLDILYHTFRKLSICKNEFVIKRAVTGKQQLFYYSACYFKQALEILFGERGQPTIAYSLYKHIIDIVDI